jgi:hypothetical protein
MAHAFGSPCWQAEPKGGGEKFRLFSNTLPLPLDFPHQSMV